jgi:hypothetical protein
MLSPDSEPLNEDEQRRAYLSQCQLGAVKRCANCGKTKPVDQFAGYRRLTCWDCGRPTAAPQTSMEYRFERTTVAVRVAREALRA